MPLPKPREGETRDQFVSRCVVDDTVVADFDSEEQRVAVCYSQWEKRDEDNSLSNDGKMVYDYKDKRGHNMTKQVIHKQYLELELKNLHTEEFEEQGIMEAVASTFGNVDYQGDVILPGAFDKTLAEKSPKKVKFLYQHDYREVLGTIKELTRDEKGLRMKAQFSLGTTAGREKFELVKDGALDAVSIGFSIPRNKSQVRPDGIREISEINLMEVSLVTFPANPLAEVTGAKDQHQLVRSIMHEFDVDYEKARAYLGHLKALAGEANTDAPQAAADEKSRDDLSEIAALLRGGKL